VDALAGLDVGPRASRPVPLRGVAAPLGTHTRFDEGGPSRGAQAPPLLPPEQRGQRSAGMPAALGMQPIFVPRHGAASLFLGRQMSGTIIALTRPRHTPPFLPAAGKGLASPGNKQTLLRGMPAPQGRVTKFDD